ncbi:hypothetical protein BU23DRAFT_517671 [Bimuria novae-zelandiae CBS 107.79]|uniref:Nuclear pore complex protein Nup85 n=1 Tax=Bimuria novae-zelandiae CBS 107.79 TaxID=1447943 RepID=A0A6A5UNX2_9PLEO|nr:hypothetical protein BU23DRAFT_517671 [Bimuria novae-zelandiae CBS 107.79]
MFRVPDSDDSIAPSTPDRSRKSFAGPSTTPAGPPPGQSFFGPTSTPAGAPPSFSLFGDAKPNFDPKPYNFNNSLFASSPPKNDVLEGNGQGHYRTSSDGRPGSQRGRAPSSEFGRFPLHPSAPTQDEDMGKDGEGEEDEEMDGSAGDEQPLAQRHTRLRDSFSQSLVSRSSVGEGYAPEQFGPTKVVRSGAKLQRYDLLNLAKGLAPNTDRAITLESDDIILKTERILENLHARLEGNAPAPKNEALGDAVQELLAVWRTSSSKKLSLATTLSELLLGIHHRGPFGPENGDLSASRAFMHPGSEPSRPIPKVLLDWLNTHRPADEETDEVLQEDGGYSKHALFWDVVQTTALRGQFTTTMRLLNGANFAVAHTAEEDEEMTGYHGPKLKYATQAASEAVILLRQCPGLNDDWDVKGHDWSIFRQRAQQAKRDLEEFAEGDSQSRFTMSQSLSGSHFGLSQSRANFSLSTHSRKVECKVPWSVYEQLLQLYNVLSGDENEILKWSQTWIEATLCLTIWWNGEEYEPSQGSLVTSRLSLTRSNRPQDTSFEAYAGRLSACLASILDSDDEDLSLSITSAFDVALACVVDDNVEGALHILRKQSLTAAAAVAEVASAGGWLKHDGVFGQLDQSDLLLLSYNQSSRTGLSKDELLAAYADQLAFKNELSSQDGSPARAGWELAIVILGRLDDTGLANERIQRILDELPLTSAEQVDKVTQLCHSMSLSDQALRISLKYADYLQANTQNYGDAILYYARAHAAPKIQEVLRALVAHCLIKSIAYPPLSELDASLKKLVTFPKKTLTELAALDSEAAELLSNSLSGYATIRKFYDLRDEEVLLKEGDKPAHRPLARKRTAANALIVIIASASSSIRGGLYDPEVETVVQVDVLLSLLGEALVFINQPKRTLTLRNLYDLLAAVEDFSTAPSMIQAQCEEALRTTLAAAHENSPRSSLNKSTSNLTTASSQYSLIGSMDLGSVEGVSTDSSTVLVKGSGVDDVKRAWDWRKGFPRGAKGEDVIRILRLGIAKELGRAFAEGEFKP